MTMTMMMTTPITESYDSVAFRVMPGNAMVSMIMYVLNIAPHDCKLLYTLLISLPGAEWRTFFDNDVLSRCNGSMIKCR